MLLVPTGPGLSTTQPALGLPLPDLNGGLEPLFDIGYRPHTDEDFDFLQLCDFEVIEGPRDVVVRAELPEFEQEVFDIRFRNDILTIRVQKQGRSGRESCSRTFCRKLALPSGLNAEWMQVISHNGTLEIRLPWAEGYP